jgi:hypothetical protein
MFPPPSVALVRLLLRSCSGRFFAALASSSYEVKTL